MWVEKGEGRREWGWEEKGEEERKMNHFPDLVIFDSIIPSERNKVLMTEGCWVLEADKREDLLVWSVQALSREKCLDKIAWLFHWAIENRGA